MARWRSTSLPSEKVCPDRRRSGFRIRGVERLREAIVSLLCAAISVVCSTPATQARPAIQVWYSPDNDTSDYLDLFRNPERWQSARSEVSVFKFGPQQVDVWRRERKNSLKELSEVDAFHQLQLWGIKIAIEAPAIKKWDCNGNNAENHTADMIQNVERAGGVVDYIAMDEPLSAGLRVCGDSVDSAAEKTARYAMALKGRFPHIQIGDIEPFPLVSIDRARSWLAALERHGFTPAFYHLDVNISYVDVHPEIDISSVLRDLVKITKSIGVPFGIIFWNGYDPAPTDQDYYKRTMAWVRRVHAAIGAPDDAVFQSWVHRSSPRCKDTDRACLNSNLRCGPDDPPGCGELSVPINLPDEGVGTHSHTLLIKEAMRVLRGGS